MSLEILLEEPLFALVIHNLERILKKTITRKLSPSEAAEYRKSIYERFIKEIRSHIKEMQQNQQIKWGPNSKIFLKAKSTYLKQLHKKKYQFRSRLALEKSTKTQKQTVKRLKRQLDSQSMDELNGQGQWEFSNQIEVSKSLENDVPDFLNDEPSSHLRIPSQPSESKEEQDEPSQRGVEIQLMNQFESSAIFEGIFFED